MDSFWQWTLLVVCSTVALSQAYYLFSREHKRTKVNEDFLLEAEMKYGHSRFQKLPEAELYNTLKCKILEQMKRTITDLPDSYEEPLELEPERSWLRKLPTEPHHMLCRALLERAIASMPRFRMLYADLQPKYFMLQNQLISEKQWSSLLKSRSDVEEEVDFLRHESVRLRPQWADDAIFQEAGYVLRQRETQKK